MLLAHYSLALATGLVSCAHVFGRHINTFAGPYIAYLHRAEACPSDGSITLNLWSSHFHPNRPLELQTLRGNVTFKIPVDDSMWAISNVATRSNNQWKDNAFIMNFPAGACSQLRDNFSVVLRLLQLKLDRKDPCVIPSGQYDIKNQTVSWVSPKIKIMPYGHYRATITVGSRGSRTKRACQVMDYEIIPKPN